MEVVLTSNDNNGIFPYLSEPVYSSWQVRLRPPWFLIVTFDLVPRCTVIVWLLQFPISLSACYSKHGNKERTFPSYIVLPETVLHRAQDKETNASLDGLSSLSSSLDVERSLVSLGFWACPKVPRTWAGRVAMASAIRMKTLWKGFCRNWLRLTKYSFRSSSVGCEKFETRFL